MARSYTKTQIAIIRSKQARIGVSTTKTAPAATAPATVAAVAAKTAPRPKRPPFRDRQGGRMIVRMVGSNIEVRYQGRPGETGADVRRAFDALFWKGAGDIVIPSMCVRIGLCGKEQPVEGEWFANAPIGEFKERARRPRNAEHAARMDREREVQGRMLAAWSDPGRHSYHETRHYRDHGTPHEAQLRNGNW
jgi:hypothetical protein